MNYKEEKEKAVSFLTDLIAKKGGTLAFSTPVHYMYDFDEEGTEYNVELLDIRLKDGRFVATAVTYNAETDLEDIPEESRNVEEITLRASEDFIKMIINLKEHNHYYAAN